MKVSYRGRVRKFKEFPKDMEEFRQTVQAKFMKCKLITPDDEESKKLANAMDQEDNDQFADMINESI